MAPTTVFDRATIRHNLTEFKLRWLAHIEQWKAENRPATESSHDQQFWGDLLDCFGVNARDLYLYQRSAKRASTGRTGKIDMFMPGKVIGEAKSLGVPLDDAHAQAPRLPVGRYYRELAHAGLCCLLQLRDPAGYPS